MLVCCEDFAHLRLFLEMVGAPQLRIDPASESTNVEFFTEYGFFESVVGNASERFPTRPAGRDTPDILIYVEASPSVLVGVEAKMYDNTTADALNRQLAAQQQLLEGIAADLPTEVAVHHVALLPSRLAESIGELSAPVVTWEQVLRRTSTWAPRTGVTCFARHWNDTTSW